MDAQGDAIFRRDSTSRLTYANDAFFRLFGLTPGRAIGYPFAPEPPFRPRRNPARRWTMAAILAGLSMMIGTAAILYSGAPGLAAQLGLVLADEVLGVVRAVERLALGVLAGPGVVASHDEVGDPVVAPDDRVPDGLPGSPHAHGER